MFLKPQRRLLIAALMFIAMLTGLSLWLMHISVPQGAAVRLQAGGSLRVGFAVEAPYAYLDTQGRVTGEAPEIFGRVAQRLGVQHIDWVPMEFASLLPSLQLGRIDVIAAGMFITPERQRLVLFSRPTAQVRTGLVVRQDDPRLPAKPVIADLKGLRDLRWVAVHDAAENGLLLQAGVPPERLAAVPHAERGVRAVVEAQADVLAISTVTAWQLVAAHPQWALEVRTLTDAPAGLPAFVFRQEDHALRDAVDQILLSFLGSDEHVQLVRSFGFTSDELPPRLP